MASSHRILLLPFSIFFLDHSGNKGTSRRILEKFKVKSQIKKSLKCKLSLDIMGDVKKNDQGHYHVLLKLIRTYSFIRLSNCLSIMLNQNKQTFYFKFYVLSLTWFQIFTIPNSDKNDFPGNLFFSPLYFCFFFKDKKDVIF